MIHIAKNIIVLLFGIPGLIIAQSTPKFSVTGGARSLLSNAEISVKDSVPDNVTARKNAGGYALMDLGFNIRPNQNTEIMGMIRINNRFGGFWGAGVSFDVRQLWLKGIIADRVRYQLGDINLKQTPFTFWNHDEDNRIQLPAVFGLQRDIVNYETFYVPNTWRQQGAAMNFGLESGKMKSEWNFHSYLNRLNATNFGSQPERLHFGSTANWIFHKNLTVAYNLSRVFDVKETALSNIRFQNTVNTASWEYNQLLKGRLITLGGEAGNSSYRWLQDTAAPHLQDYFVHAFLRIGNKEKHWSVEGGYLNVGPDFRSVAAQSKRLDVGAQPMFYNRYTQLQLDRPLNLLDYTTNTALFRNGISTKLQAYNPILNNVMPYGMATFNRSGLYMKSKWQHTKKIVTAEVQYYKLSEILGQGTSELKKFRMTQAHLNWDIGKMLGYKKQWKLQVSACQQQTLRNSTRNYEVVKLNSMQLGAGMESEIMSSIDILAGYTMLQGKGNEMLAARNGYTEVIDFTGYNANLQNNAAAAGLRVRFSNKTYLSLLYQRMNYRNLLQPYQNYTIGQFQAIYNMTF
ncbi:MAG: hypothetical protein EBV15_00220 [Bacteroidetes bacterium]|nr:hypothetical protein [Bacteroidota bacterium]